MNKILYSLLLFSFLQAIIIESDYIAIIMPHIYHSDTLDDVLVIFDIDNTLGHVTDGYGGDEWFTAMIQERISQGDSIHMALAYVLPLYFALQQQVWLEPVEAETPSLIRFLQRAGIPIMALTSRSIDIKDRTQAQMSHMGIELILTAPHAHTLVFQEHIEAYYENGILFSASHNKGEVLLQFFASTGYRPKKVIFIDDKLKYIEQVETGLKQTGIECVAIRYGHLDQKVKSYRLPKYKKAVA